MNSQELVCTRAPQACAVRKARRNWRKLTGAFVAGGTGAAVLAEWNTMRAFGATPRGIDGGGTNGAAPFGGAAISTGAKPIAWKPLPATVPTTWVPCVAKSCAVMTGAGGGPGGSGGAPASLAFAISATRTL